MTLSDIENRADIDRLMQLFYSRAMVDERIGRFFTEVVRLDLDEHLPVIGDFWESVLFGTTAYRRYGRTPLTVHAELDQKLRLEPEHFERWIELFVSAIDELFSGPRAEGAKVRARAIVLRMTEFIGAARRREMAGVGE